MATGPDHAGCRRRPTEGAIFEGPAGFEGPVSVAGSGSVTGQAPRIGSVESTTVEPIGS